MTADRHDRDRARRFASDDLTRRILARTSGGACRRAEALLAARWDGEPAPADAALLAGHLERCAACRQVARALDWARPRLTWLAVREPGPAFTAAVLARTVPRRPRRTDPAAASPAPLAGARRRLAASLQRLWWRPRIALEGAWAVCALAALLVWGPLAPAGVPTEASRLVRAGAASVPELVQTAAVAGEAALTAGHEQVAPLAARAVAATGRAVDLVRSWWALARDLAGERPAAPPGQRPEDPDVSDSASGDDAASLPAGAGAPDPTTAPGGRPARRTDHGE
jgi:hypothetical protein